MWAFPVIQTTSWYFDISKPTFSEGAALVSPLRGYTADAQHTTSKLTVEAIAESEGRGPPLSCENAGLGLQRAARLERSPGTNTGFWREWYC